MERDIVLEYNTLKFDTVHESDEDEDSEMKLFGGFQ